jgi:hypothetical protein
MEPRARVVEAAAARFNRVAEASLAALELEEAARWEENGVSNRVHAIEAHSVAIGVVAACRGSWL